MKWLSHSLFLAAMLSTATISFVACSKPESSLEPKAEAPSKPKAAVPSHVGTWRCPPGGGTQESELGPVRFRLKLTADGQMEMRSEVIDSPGGDRTTEDKGTYVLEGDRFTSEEIGRGEPYKLTMENDQLIMTTSFGPYEVYRYERIEK
jgi:hypothetical protein